MADSSIFEKLKKLFSTGAIVRNVGGRELKVADTDASQAFTTNAMRDRFSRIHSGAAGGYSGNQYGQNMAYQSQRIMLFRDYDCIGGDTKIPLPDGTTPTIEELAKKWQISPDPFYVFSYDLVSNSVVLGNAHSVRSKGIQPTKKITFDKGRVLYVTHDHPLLMRDGSYKLAGDVAVGDRVMPFYRKDFYKNGYRSIFNFSKGWQSEHHIVAEQFHRALEKNEVVHHKDFNKENNHPSNLHIMGDVEHRNYHCNIINKKLWSAENREKQIAAIRAAVVNRQKFSWNGTRKGTNNPFHGKKHSTERNDILSTRMKTWHESHNIFGTNNPNFRDDLTYDVLLSAASDFYIERGKLNQQDFIKKVKCNIHTLKSRISDWKQFKLNVLERVNHKIISIEDGDDIEVFDMSVDGFNNFATTELFVHNCMDNDSIIASALDIYSDESTVKNEYGEILTIQSENAEIKDIVHNLFYDILNIEFNLWPWIRNMCKYGDFFLFLEIAPEYGIHNVLPLSVYDTVRLEGEKPENPYFVQFETMGMNGAKQKFDNYEIAHFRLMSDANYMPYGKAMIESARRGFRQLSLMEDAMMIHRIMRAPEKRVFKVDIGNIPPAEVNAYIENLMAKTKKTPFQDPQTGDYNLRYNMQNLLEDYYLPVRGNDSGTSIENLGGLEYNSIDDIEYLRNKMMAALKIPKAFLGYDENVNGKATLAAEDVRFARTIERIQRIVVSELKKIAIVHLYAQGYTDDELVDFELQLTNPSTIYEQEKVNLWTQKVGLVTQMQQSKMFSDEWMYQNVFDLHEDDMKTMRKDLIRDTKYRFRLNAIEQGNPDPAKFGYPQEHEAPQEGAMGGAPGASPQGNGAPQADGAPSGPTPQSVDDLPTAAELGLEEDTETRGRPKTGATYAQDSHVRGRDPLGFKERYNSMKVGTERKPSYKSPLSLESSNMLKSMASKISVTERRAKKLLENSSDDKNTYLDESVLLENLTDTE